MKFAKILYGWHNCLKNLNKGESQIAAIKIMDTPVVFRCLENILDFLKKDKSSKGVAELLEVYDDVTDKYSRNFDKTKNKFPLIVLEGLDGCGKTTISKVLAKRLHVDVWCTPPTSIQHLRHVYDENLRLRSAYYSLGNYIAAMEVSLLLIHKPIILDRFWHSTAGFAIAQAVEDQPETINLPPPNDEFYNWPVDLLKPDLVIFLNVSESVRLSRHSRRNTTNTDQEQLLKISSRFRENVIKAYKNMKNPGIEFVNADLNVNSVINQILGVIKVSGLNVSI